MFDLNLYFFFSLKDSEKRTPLHAAAHCGEVECLKVLINNGKFVNTVDSLYLDLARDQKICSTYKEVRDRES